MSFSFSILPFVLIISIIFGSYATAVQVQDISNAVKQIFKDTLLLDILGAVNRLENKNAGEDLKVDATDDVEMFRAIPDDIPTKQYLLVRIKMILRVARSPRFAWFGVELSDNIPSAQQPQLKESAKKLLGIKLWKVLDISEDNDPCKDDLARAHGVKLKAADGGAEFIDFAQMHLKKRLLLALLAVVNMPGQLLQLIKQHDPTGMAEKELLKLFFTPILDMIWESEAVGEIGAAVVELLKGICCLIFGISN